MIDWTHDAELLCSFACGALSAACAIALLGPWLWTL